MGELVLEVAERLKIARLANLFKTAKEFAIHHSIPVTTYAQHESGKRALGIESLFSYAEMLGVDPAWLLTGRSPAVTDLDKDLLEGRIFERQERALYSGNTHVGNMFFIDENKKFSTINITLLRNILAQICLLYTQVPGHNVMNLIDFSFDLYNKIIGINGNESEKNMLISLSVSSFLKGVGITASDDIVKRISSAL
ncbi:Helix-turn-helix domain protein [Legionella geestiana]|uniref:Helix-turn-helix domain protein n=1 Tax=Legionella geestiana TaxID=45065 RepID=A0A0W0UA18_9GAMM|nr:helix-turn-helix transcriptional regulator [Legionella geestiana]KTD04518.1 Helix-turn-helix domain protein [Legionella geestiana]QBS12287.1 XRE family transcriptional regulator [Legionella geestiana]STX52978.1 Helix-turn-helix domain [Legionella geestiana]